MDRDKRTRLFIDVGTNCEIVLSDGDRILSTAAPAGPAFEGGAIRCGMRAADGAIEVVKLDPDGGRRAPGDRRRRARAGCAAPAWSTRWPSWSGSGCSTPAGGSSPTSVAEELAPGLADRLTEIGEERVFVLHRPDPGHRPGRVRLLSQRDVRELQFAKAAISTGWTLLLEELGLEHRDVQQVLLAGSFGSYLSAGLRGPHRAGAEASGAAHRRGRQRRRRGREDGAAVACASAPVPQALLEEVTYVELSDRPDFNDRFVDQLAFPS